MLLFVFIIGTRSSFFFSTFKDELINYKYNGWIKLTMKIIIICQPNSQKPSFHTYGLCTSSDWELSQKLTFNTHFSIFLSLLLIPISESRWIKSVADEIVNRCMHKPFNPLRVLPFPSDLVGDSIDAGPSIIDGELDGVICLPDQVQVALVVLVSLTRHTNQGLTAADNHRLVLPVDPW